MYWGVNACGSVFKCCDLWETPAGGWYGAMALPTLCRPLLDAASDEAQGAGLHRRAQDGIQLFLLREDESSHQ